MKQIEELQESSFWLGKVPCWEIRGCIPEARNLCRAYLDQSQPCWELEDALCKELFDIDTCFVCKVFKRYGPKNKKKVG